jgi:flagellar protein FliO/FliZ
MSNPAMSLLAFVLVIALIPAALWLMKRSGVGGAAVGGVLRPVASLSLGASQRVAVVEVAVGAQRQWLVLGVTGERIASLATYAAPDLPPAPSSPAHATAVNQLIARWRGAAGASDSNGGGTA